MRDITADLDPPLGYPGGSCHLIDRAVSEMGRNSEPFVKQVEEGEKFTRTMEQELYDDRLEGRVKGTGFRFLALTPHAQYRMDQRGINEQEVRAALRDYWKEYSKNPQRWQRDKENSRLIPSLSRISSISCENLVRCSRIFLFLLILMRICFDESDRRAHV